MKVEFLRHDKGFSVKVGKAHLPGYYTNLIAAEKAVDKYISGYNKYNEKKKKQDTQTKKA